MKRFPLILFTICCCAGMTACNWEAFFQDGETYFEGRVTYQDTGEAVREAKIIIIGEEAMGFSGGRVATSDTIALNNEGYFEALIKDAPETDHYGVLVFVDGNTVELKDTNCNNNVNSCAGLQPDEEHSVILQI